MNHTRHPLVSLTILPFLLSIPGLASRAAGEPSLDTAGEERLYRALPRIEVELEPDGRRVEFPLPDERLVRFSERVVLDGRVLDPLIEYRLDYDAGVLELLGEPPPSGTSLTVSYRHLPLAEAPVPALNLPVSSAAYRGSGDSLEVSGSKGVGLRLDSAGGLGIIQSLDVSLSGELTGGLRLEGVLSDQDLPVRPEGTTAELEELDEIRLSAWTDNLRLDLGDYDLAGPLGSVEESYGPGRRRLEGGQVRLDYDAWGALAVLSASPAQSAAWRFTPTPGVAGPYLLQGNYGETNLVVVPGSERVYLDEHLLERGLDSDYTIDYSRGSLTLNPTLSPPVGAELLVRFEYSARGYRRNLYGGGLRLTLGALDWSLSYYDEADDAEADLWGMGEEDREDLERAGDDPLVRPLDGAGAYEYVGDGRGGYELIYDPGTGNYRFEPRVGGDYRRRSWTLPAPRRHRLALLTGGLRGEWLVGELELALSEKDLNTLSLRHDDDNAGLAGRLDLSGELPLGDDALSFELSGEHREADFRALTPQQGDPELHLRWGYDPVATALLERLEGRLGYRFADGPRLWLGGGGLRRDIPPGRVYTQEVDSSPPRELRRRQFELAAGLDWPGSVGLNYTYRRQSGWSDDAETPGKTIELGAEIHRLELAPSLGAWRPRAELALDERRGSPDRRTADYLLGLGWSPVPGLALDYELLAGRSYGALDDGRPLETGHLSHRSTLRWHSDSLRLRLAYLRRDAFDRREEPLEVDGVTDSGGLDLGWTAASGGLTLDLDYELARSWSYPLIEQFVYSPDGVGSYRREEDPDDPGGWIYIFDPGDPEAYYDRELLPAGEPLRAVDAAAGLALSLTPRRFSRAAWAELFQLDVSMRAAGTGPGSTLERALFTSLFDEEALSGELETRVDLELWPTSARGGLGASFRWSDGLDARLRPRRERFGERAWELRGDMAPLTPLRLYAGGRFVEEWRSGAPAYYGAGDSERRVQRYEAWLEPRLTFGPWRPRLRLEYRDALQDAAAGRSELISWTLHPALGVSLADWGSLELSWRRREHDLDGPPTTESLIYRRPGVDHRWRAWLSISLGRSLTLTFSYTGENEPERESVHRGELLAKLFF